MTVVLEAGETTLEEVLKYTAAGSDVHLQRQGHRLATINSESDLFAPLTSEQKERAKAALASMDERAKRLSLNFSLEEIIAARDFGRR
jgi:hypothetical protein